MSEIRIAKVSTIDSKNKKISVLYPDRGRSVSKMLPCIASEFSAIKVGDTVIVATVSNATDGSAVVLGKI